MARKSLVLVLGLGLLMGSCRTIQPKALKPQQVTSPVSSERAEQDLYQLPFRKLVDYYRQWQKQGVSIREALTRLPHLGRVYTIDDHHTAVRVLRNPVSYEVYKSTEKEFMALGVAYGGKLYTLVRDSLTGKLVPFRRVEIRDNKDLKSIYWVNLSDPKKNYDFLYRPDGSLPRLRLEGGQMRITDVLTTVASKGTFRYLDTLILEHPVTQPFVYSTPNLPPLSAIPAQAAGGKLEDIPVFKKKTGFGSILKGFFNTNKALVEEDKIEYVLAICHKAGGRARWVVSKRPRDEEQRRRNRTIRTHLGVQWVNGELVEVDPVSGWLYATTDQRYIGVRPEWYIGCEAVQPFVLKAMYRQSRGGGAWWYDELLYPGRQISEMKFTAVEAGSSSHITKSQPGSGADPVAKTLALQTASTGNPVTQVVGAARYESSYNGRDTQGCVLVSVTRVSDTTPKKKIPALETTFNYRICGKQVEDLGITMPEAIRKDVLEQLSAFSRTCQRYGETKMRTVNYELYCRPLRGESQCKVEISVLKEGHLLEKFLYDGCTGRQIH